MVSADTYPNPVSWSTSGDRKNGYTAVTIYFFMDPSKAVYLLNITWCCRNFSVLSAGSWAVTIVGG